MQIFWLRWISQIFSLKNWTLNIKSKEFISAVGFLKWGLWKIDFYIIFWDIVLMCFNPGFWGISKGILLQRQAASNSWWQTTWHHVFPLLLLAFYRCSLVREKHKMIHWSSVGVQAKILNRKNDSRDVTQYSDEKL